MNKQALKPNRMLIASAVNFIYGGAELAVSQMEGSHALLSAGVHETSDGFAHGIKGVTENLQKDLHDRRIRRLRVVVRSMICASALLVGVSAAEELRQDRAETLGPTAVLVALGGVAVHGGVAAMLYTKREENGLYSDAFRHAGADALSSFIAVGGTYLAARGYADADPAAAIAGASVTIALNLPWRIHDQHGH